MENLVVLVSWLSFRFYRCIFMQVVTQIYTPVLASNMQCIFQKYDKMQGNKKKSVLFTPNIKMLSENSRTGS